MKQRYLYLFIDRLTADYAFELGSTVLLKNNIKHEQDQKKHKDASVKNTDEDQLFQ